MTNERSKLEINQDGILKETGKQLDVSKIDKLISVNFEPKNGWIVLQPLPDKETVTKSGLIIPGSKKEMKAAVIATKNDSEYKRGQVVMIDPAMFGPNVPGVDYIEGEPTLMVPEHFIKGIYTKYDLSNWK